jgi:Protein of unknown function (DUF4242)
MPLFLDVHTVPGATSEAVAGAHELDLAVQDQYGVKMLKYWLDESSGRISCLAEAPTKEAVNQVHQQAHGLLATEVFQVTEGG